MMKVLLTCLALLSSTTVNANEAPPVPEGGLRFISQQACVDKESGEKGDCFIGQAKDGKIFLTFWQGDILMFIREIAGDSYVTIWVNERFNSI